MEDAQPTIIADMKYAARVICGAIAGTAGVVLAGATYLAGPEIGIKVAAATDASTLVTIAACSLGAVAGAPVAYPFAKRIMRFNKRLREYILPQDFNFV